MNKVVKTLLFISVVAVLSLGTVDPVIAVAMEAMRPP